MSIPPMQLLNPLQPRSTNPHSWHRLYTRHGAVLDSCPCPQEPHDFAQARHRILNSTCPRTHGFLREQSRRAVRHRPSPANTTGTEERAAEADRAENASHYRRKHPQRRIRDSRFSLCEDIYNILQGPWPVSKQSRSNLRGFPP